MNRQRLPRRLFLWTILILVLLGTLACEPEPTGPRAWIDFPRDGASIPVGAPVTVLSHVFAPEGVAEVLLSVNGIAYRRSPPSAAGDFAKASHEWLPDREGDVVLEVTAFSAKGEASAPARARVRVLGKTTPTPVRPTSITSPLPPPVTTVPALPAPPTTVAPVARADLAIVSVDAVVVGYKGDLALCRPRVTYRNAGTIPVPNDYVIQLTVNGTPQTTITRGAGFGIGGTSEAVFDYMFEGAPNIGVTLDSTNTITESDETNNTLTQILRCNGTATPATPTFTPTRTPTIPPPAGCVGTPIIAFFSASPTAIYQGQSATLSWGAVTNADFVSIEPGIGGVAAPGSHVVVPMNTTTFTLTARCGATTVTRQVTIVVTPPPTRTFTPTRTRTPTTPPDTTPPAIPNPLDPTGGKSVACSGATGSATLRWSSVSDPSGVTYYVKWSGGGQSGGWEGTGTSHGISIKCGYQYSWQVRACDGKGNCSNWSGSATFLAGTLH